MSETENEEESSYDTYALDQAKEIVFDRAETHGEPEDSFETIAGKWTAHLRALLKSQGIDPEEFEVKPSDVCDMMIDLKTSRNAEGHYHSDNNIDIAGYAENGERLKNDKT